MLTLVRISFLLLSLATPGLFAQYWEHTGGPAGVEKMLSAFISPNGDLYVFSNSLHRSTDKGATWERLSPEMTFATTGRPPRIVWLQSGTAFMYLADTLYRSTDNCNTWTKLPALDPAYGMTVSREGYLIIAFYDCIRITSDEGDSWKR